MAAPWHDAARNAPARPESPRANCQLLADLDDLAARLAFKPRVVVGHASCSSPGMLNLGAIKPHMPVLCSEGGQFAVVDHMSSDNRTIKLAKDKKGEHHYIPISWVKTIDNAVHIDRPGSQAMREWSSEAA